MLQQARWRYGLSLSARQRRPKRGHGSRSRQGRNQSPGRRLDNENRSVDSAQSREAPPARRNAGVATVVPETKLTLDASETRGANVIKVKEEVGKEAHLLPDSATGHQTDYTPQMDSWLATTLSAERPPPHGTSPTP